MTTYDNQPPQPDWHCEPRAPVFDLVTRVKAKLEADLIPGPHIFLGEN